MFKSGDTITTVLSIYVTNAQSPISIHKLLPKQINYEAVKIYQPQI